MHEFKVNITASDDLQQALSERPLKAGVFSLDAWGRYLTLIIASGLAGSGALLFFYAEAWGYALREILSGKKPFYGWEVSGFWVDVLPAVWVVLILVAVMRIRDLYFPGTQGTGIPQVIAALEQPADSPLRRKMLSGRILIGKMMLLLLAIIGGVTVGREGPSVHVAACVFFIAMQWVTFPRHLVERGLLIAGGSAGIAAAFNTPVAAIVFGIEELSGSFNKKNATCIGIVVALTCVIGVIALGDYYFYGHVNGMFHEIADWWVILPVSVAGGLMGGTFARAVWLGAPLIHRLSSAHPWRTALVLGLGCAFMGIISGGLSYGSGYLEAFDILHNKEVFPWYYPFTKAIANGIALISGVPGGLFDPSLSVGAGFGQLTANWLEINNATPVIMAFMVAYFSGVVQSPITAFVIVIEMTGAHHMVLPLCITSMIACNCSKLVCKQGLYDALAKLFMDGLEQYQQKHAK